MKFHLAICGVHELPELDDTTWTHVISIWDKEYADNAACRKKVKDVAPQAEILYSFFDDVDDSGVPQAPTLRHIRRILEFTEKIPAKARVLVHCRAGVSRSTATAYAILCQHSDGGDEMDNLRRVHQLRNLCLPNRLIIQHADKILKRSGSMLLPLRR